MLRIKYYDFSETQARGDLNNDGNFKNGSDFGNARNVEMLGISGMSEQT